MNMQHAMQPRYPLAFDADLSFLWGKAKGIGFFARHERIPTNDEMHAAIVDVSRAMGWTFDESTFAAFARAMAEHANEDECRKAQANLEWLMSESEG